MARNIASLEWLHGWEYYASSSSEHHSRKNVVLNQSCAADQAHLRSHSGPGASDVLCGCPSKPEFRIEAIILERVRLPLQVTEVRCECGVPLDNRGRHRAASSRSGRLKSRALAPERTPARVCREAGATVRYNAKLRDMDLDVSANNDDRATEVLATGLPLYFGAQLAVDITLRCALASDGTAQPGAARMDGAVCTRAWEDKERKYSEAVALETGGRWSEESLQFVESLAAVRARDAPPALFHSAALAWRRRWARMIAVSCARSFASSLVAIPSTALQSLGGADGCVPDLADLFEAA